MAGMWFVLPHVITLVTALVLFSAGAMALADAKRRRSHYGEVVAAVHNTIARDPAEFDLETMVADLALLVGTESPSNDRDALDASAQALSRLLSDRLGSEAELVHGPAGPHVWWRAAGTPRVLLLGHHDTVFDLGTHVERPFRIEDGRAYGPGVFDMKAGIVQAIHAVAALEDRSGIEILMTCDEEVGSLTSRQLLEERAAVCGAVLVLEPSADGGALKVGRKGTGTFEVVVTGRAAHAGLEPERGRNSLIEAARLVLEVASFADPDRGTTVTPTVCHAGTADNVVPAYTTLRVDVRVTSADEAERVQACFAGLEGTECEVVVLGAIGRPPMAPETAESLLPLALAVAPDLAAVEVGGASDGNFTAALGIPTLDGLGAVGGGAHADHEYVEVATMPGRAALLSGILAQLLH
jgi:glutamate carboxypeptidase